MKPTLIIDCGHGGIDPEGVYTTPAIIGKKFQHKGQVLHGDGWFYEGVGNRVMGHLLAARALNEGYPIYFTNHQIKDDSLFSRSQQAKILWNGGKRIKSVVVSLHSNAGGGEGYEIYTPRGFTKSDHLATCIANRTKELLPDRKYRFDYLDGDPDKEANHYITRMVPQPAVLIEFGFFDNPKEVKELVNLDILHTFARATWEGVKEFYKTY